MLLDFRDDFCNLVPQNLLPGHDFLNLGVELPDVDLLPSVLRLHIGGHGQVVAVLCDLAVLRQMGEPRILSWVSDWVSG